MATRRLHKLKGFAQNTLINLGCGLRAALLLRVNPDRLATSWLQITAALLLCLAPPLVSQLILAGTDGEFTTYGLQGVWLPFVLIFMVTALSGKLFGADEQVRPLILLLLNAYVIVDVAISVLHFCLQKFALPSYTRFLFGDPGGYWLGLILAAQLIRIQPYRHGRSWAAAVVMGGVLAFAATAVWRVNVLWSAPYDDRQADEEQQEYYAAVAEEVLYLQPKLLADRLSRLQAGPVDATNLYFIGVAGDAGQRVFVREIRWIEQLFLQRFTAPERSALLINSRETLRTDPVATGTALRQTIERMAEVMDRDKDILFIYLTSHGSKEHRLALSFPPLQLNELEPGALRKMLDEAGIQWRVIVVSACYSGGFIAPLADEKTLVITAAAADKTSFGCGDDNDFTYFGKAYFADAMSRSDSFIEAFTQAKELVTEREKAESETPSEPQISIGSEIGARLDVFQAGRQLKAPQQHASSTD